MIRLCGAMLVFTAPMLMCIKRYLFCIHRAAVLNAFLCCFEYCADEIRCSLTPIPELTQTFSCDGPDELREFWSEVEKETGTKGMGAFSQIWRNALVHLPLTQADISVLIEFPAAIRSYDTVAVGGALAHLHRRTEERMMEVRHRFQREFKLYVALHICAALLLLIVLF